MESSFIDALVKACSCRQSTRANPPKIPLSSPLFTHHRTRRRNARSTYKQRCDVLGARLHTRAQSTSARLSREEYRQLLDYYHEPDDTLAPSLGFGPIALVLPDPSNNNVGKNDPDVSRREPPEPLPSKHLHVKALHESDASSGSSGAKLHNPSETSDDDSFGGELLSREAAGDYKLGSRKESLGLDTEEEQHVLEHLHRLLEDPVSSHSSIYEAYLRLPSPGVKYLSGNSRRLLFNRLSVIEVKTKKAMLRYMSLVEDMKEASLRLTQAEWNTAIAYAGRCYVRVEALQVGSALRIWKEMEQEAQVRSGFMTFNILFDIATKAGKYVLAEMILEEMVARGLEYSRFSHVGFIYYHGLKGDGAGVRKAYKDLVEAGQIVDTTVMNCVIASLIRAGELAAAEQVYERMKRILYEKTGQFVPSSDWRHSRDLGRVLDKASRTLRNDHERLKRLQSEQCLAPNLRTFSIFIDYHVHITGELRRVIALLHEMQDLDIPIHGRIFLKIFKGFARHGGVKYTSWTTQRLESVWKSLLLATDEQTEGVHIMKWMVVWVIRAFAQCCGKERAAQIWEELRDRWKVTNDDEKGAVEHLLRNVLEEARREEKH
ncbi:MAG: hypothetical protein Q9181_006375 [Wetmoreana brouardii]